MLALLVAATLPAFAPMPRLVHCCHTRMRAVCTLGQPTNIYDLKAEAAVEADPREGDDIDREHLEVVVDKMTVSWTGVARQNVISIFDPNERFWLARKWHSTVLQIIWPNLLFNVLSTTLFIALVRRTAYAGVAGGLWPFFTAPDPTSLLVLRLAPLYTMWTHHATLTTFVLTFFIAEAFSYWKRALCAGRCVRAQRFLLDVISDDLLMTS